MIRASCLCGQVSFSVREPLQQARYCHCDHCRKFSGAPAAAWAMTRRDLVDCEGSPTLGQYNSGRGTRCFCSTCGSPVWFEAGDGSGMVAIPLGIIDGGEVAAPAMRIFCSRNPAWSELVDDLPRHADYPG